VTNAAAPASPWGEPAPAMAISIRPGPDEPRNERGDGRRRPAASPSTSPAASALAARRRWRRRLPVLEERTILVRIIPRTGVFARVRAAFALAVIAVAIGLVVAGTLSVIVWGIATVIHHAAAN
jgi:hypothetical protein